MEEEKIYITGDVRFTEDAKQFDTYAHANNEGFLLQLQKLMEEYGVIKIDIGIDPFKFNAGK